MQLSIDVVIPSYRLLTETLLPILNLQYPANVTVRFYLVADNPAIIPDAAITSLIDNQKIFLIINPVNIGASKTRNAGIEAGTGDWILFLDDDITVTPNLLFAYADAIQQHPDEIGFIGLVDMPPSTNNFTDALQVSGLTDAFAIAKKHQSNAWGTTANTMVNRKAMGNIRFADVWGGEDVDFFMNIRHQNGLKNYLCLPNAVVTHPWWNNGKPEIARFWGYGKGNSTLAERNPQYKSRDFLNTPETLFIAVGVLLLVWFVDRVHSYLVVDFIILTLLLEYLISLLRVYKNKKSLNPLTAFYVMLLRNSIDGGVLFGNLSRLRLAGMGERFNFNGQTKRANFVLNSYKIVKLVVYLTAIVYTLAVGLV